MEYLILSELKSKDLEVYILYKLLQKSLKERKILYNSKDFKIDEIPKENFRLLFRFDYEHIIQLSEALQIPNRFETADQHITNGVSGLCLLLRRLSYPYRLIDLQHQFGRHFSTLSKIIKVVQTFIYSKWAIKLLNLEENKWLTQHRLKEFAAQVHAKGAPLTNCIGFLDGTAREICGPSTNQQVYSGHKRSIKFQSITLPNGIIVHTSAPYPGRRPDALILRDTAINLQLKQHCRGFCVYGDERYPLRSYLMRPFAGSELTQEQQLFNCKMSEVRICVEWSFGKLVQQFEFINLKKNQKLFKQPIGKHYLVSTLLTNAHSCFYGSLTSTFFHTECVNIREYFS